MFLLMFFEFYNGGMLSNFIMLKSKRPEKLVAKIIKQLLDGLIVMHKENYVHRDLKPDNIMLHFD